MDYLKKIDVRTAILAALSVLVVIMFIIQLVTLSALDQAQKRMQSMAIRADLMLAMVIDAELPLEVRSEGSVSASVPIHTRTPISINVDETPLQSELKAFREELREFASQ